MMPFADGHSCVKTVVAAAGCPPIVPTDGLLIRCSEDDASADSARSLLPVGSVCRGRCASGYVPHEGKLRQKCRADGAWSGSRGTCKQVFCPPIELGPNVQVC